MVARRALPFLLLCCTLVACGGDDDRDRDGRTGGVGDGPVFVDATAEPGGDGSLDAPVTTLDEAFDVAASLQVERPRIVVVAGTYPVSSRELGALAPRIDGAGPDETHFVATDATWSSAGTVDLMGATIEGALHLRADTISCASIDVAEGGALTLTGTTMASHTGSAIAGRLALVDTPDLAVTSSAFEGGTLLVDGATTASLTDVTVRDSAGTGIHVRDVSGEARLTRVQVFDVAELGLDAPDGEDQPVDGVGILIERSTSVLDDVLVARTAFRGLDVREGASTMDRITVAGGGASGVSVQGGAVVTIDELVASDAGTIVFSAQSSTTLRNATIRDGGLSCILASRGGTLVITDSTLLDCPQGHISVLNDVETTVSSSVIQSAEASACVTISANAAPVRIDGTSIAGCAGSGIGVLEATDVIVVDSEIRDVAPDPVFVDVADGVSVVDGEVTIQDNRITGNAGAGVAMLRSTGLVAGNTLANLGDAGVRAVDPRAGGERLRIADNEIAGATAAGVVVFGTSAVIEGNTIDDTVLKVSEGLGDGVVVGLGADVEIVDNTIRRSGANGLLAVDGVAGRVAGNRFVGNDAYGVRELCTDPSTPVELTYEANTYTDNGAGETASCE